MVTINQEEIIGQLLPTTYISKITLENGGNTITEDDPHIEHIRETVSKSKEDAKNIKITVDLLIKEKISDDLISSWFDKEELLKYVSIEVLQSKDSRLTSALSYGNDIIELIKRPNLLNSETDFRVGLLKDFYSTDSIQKIRDFLTKHAEMKNISLNKSADGKEGIQKFKQTQDDNGNYTFDVPYRLSFDIQSKTLQHLSYFVITKFDILKLSQDYGLKVQLLDLQKLSTRVVSEVVIDDEKTVSQTYVFYDDKNQIWTGAVNQDKNGNWFSKSRMTKDSIPLNRRMVTNTKIQDFRSLSDIKKLFIDTSKVNNLFYINSLRNSKDKIKQSEYFSNFSHSRDQSGNVKYFISFNMEKSILENSIYGELLKRSNKLKNEIVKSSFILSMRLYRKRVKESDKRSLFDQNEPLDLIANTSEYKFKTIQTINNNKSSIRESNIVLNSGNKNIRHFTGIDKTFSFLTDGLYKYVLEMQIHDGTVDYIKSKIVDLSNAKKTLERFYSIASIPSIATYVAENIEPHIQHPKEMASTKGKLSGVYDSYSGKFTQDFIEEQRRRYSGDNKLNAPWISPLSIYVDILDTFTDVLSDQEQKTKLSQTLFSFVHPSTANPNSIMTVIELIQSLIDVISRSCNVQMQSNSNVDSESFFDSSTSEFIVAKEFDQVIDSNINKMYGIDYLSSGIDDTKNTDGIKILTGELFKKRVNIETLKFFKSSDSDINITSNGQEITSKDSLKNTDFSFLSPSRIDLQKTSYILSKTDKKTTNINSNRNIKFIDDDKNTKGEIYSNIYANLFLTKDKDTTVATKFDSSEIHEEKVAANQRHLNSMLQSMFSDEDSLIIEDIKIETKIDENDIIITNIQETIKDSTTSVMENVPIIKDRNDSNKFNIIKPKPSINKVLLSLANRKSKLKNIKGKLNVK